MRIGHTVLLAQLVEDLLLLALLKHAIGRVRRNDVIRQLVGILGLSHQGNIVIAAAHQDNRLVGMRPSDTVDGLKHHEHGVDIHVRRVVDNLAAIRRARLILAKDQALDLILLVEARATEYALMSPPSSTGINSRSVNCNAMETSYHELPTRRAVFVQLIYSSVPTAGSQSSTVSMAIGVIFQHEIRPRRDGTL